MKTNHTPGPWKLISHAEWEKLHRDGAHYFSSVANENGILVAQCADRDSLALTKANARLIAAAPELLEALKDALVELEISLGHCELEEKQMLVYRIDKVKKAIAKATGED